MGWSVLVYESGGHYVSFSLADLKLYDMTKDALSTEEGVRRYGMRFVAGKRNIPDDSVDDEVKRVSGLVKRVNRGENIDLERELS